MSRLRFDRRHNSQRLACNSIWSEASGPLHSLCDVLLPVHCLLRPQQASSPGRRDSLGLRMGHFRYDRTRLCFRGASSPAPCILHILHQYVLHHRAIHLRGCPPRLGSPKGSMGLSHPVRNSVVLATSPDPDHLLRTGVAIPPRSAQQIRRG